MLQLGSWCLMLPVKPFNFYEGDLWGLPTNENHLVYKWSEGEILFSMTRLGNAASCHFASKDLRGIKPAINAFCEFVFSEFGWCRMIIAAIAVPSVERVVKKCGYIPFATKDEITFYQRLRDE